jgi:RNA polymerase sigma factor (TIGR02999 family)
VLRSSTESVSALLERYRAGEQEALDSLLPLVYNELRRLAHRYLQKERPNHTLQSTAVVHEAYLRLVKQQGARFENRAHFFAICAQLMRQVLVEYARTRKAVKRDGGYRMTLDDALLFTRGAGVDLVSLDDALKDLARLDVQQSKIVELRFFAGLSIEETAEALDISPATVKRHWDTAKMWLYREMSRRSRPTNR